MFRSFRRTASSGRAKDHSLNFGFSSIMLSFVMVCILTFSALSFLTIQSDYKLTEKTARKASDYHVAEESAYRTVAELDRELSQIYTKTDSKDSYYTAAQDMFDHVEGASRANGAFRIEDGVCHFLFTVPINTSQELLVSIRILYPEGSKTHFYEMETWKIKNTTSVS